MALILGKEYCKVDTNGRFKFPIALKRQLENPEAGFVIRQSVYTECLELWTYASFQKEVEKLHELLNPYNPDDYEVLHKLTACNTVFLDTNDRLLVPPEQKTVIAKSKEVVLQSTGKWIEIWDREAYDKKNQASGDFAKKVQALLGAKSGRVAADESSH